jgi:hypothetical protein
VRPARAAHFAARQASLAQPHVRPGPAGSEQKGATAAARAVGVISLGSGRERPARGAVRFGLTVSGAAGGMCTRPLLRATATPSAPAAAPAFTPPRLGAQNSLTPFPGPTNSPSAMSAKRATQRVVRALRSRRRGSPAPAAVAAAGVFALTLAAGCVALADGHLSLPLAARLLVLAHGGPGPYDGARPAAALPAAAEGRPVQLDGRPRPVDDVDDRPQLVDEVASEGLGEASEYAASPGRGSCDWLLLNSLPLLLLATACLLVRSTWRRFFVHMQPQGKADLLPFSVPASPTPASPLSTASAAPDDSVCRPGASPAGRQRTEDGGR